MVFAVESLRLWVCAPFHHARLAAGNRFRAPGSKPSEAPGHGHSKTWLTALPKSELRRAANGAIIQHEPRGAGRFQPSPTLLTTKNQTMKITDVATLPYDATFRDPVLVKVETDEGIYGWGEAGGIGRECACEATVQELTHYFIGQVESAERAPIDQHAAAMFPRTICVTPLPGCAIGARPGAPRP